MSAPVISDVAEDSPAERAGLAVGDALVSVNGTRAPRRHRVPAAHRRRRRRAGGASRRRGAATDGSRIEKAEGEPLGLRVDSAVFDRIRTCDNHCEFCFIYQLPKGMRRSLYLKDDDYRLSFLYGNFTTLTRFTELDAERVITERLSPLYVSIHATDPELRAADAAQPPRGDQPALARRAARRLASRCTARSSSAPGSTTAADLERTPCSTAWTASARWPASAVVPLGLCRALD